MRKYSIRHRILLFTLLPVVGTSLILTLSTIQIMGYEHLIISICLMLLLSSCAVYLAITTEQKITTQLRALQRSVMEISSGETVITIPETELIELDALAKSMQKMSAAVRASHQVPGDQVTRDRQETLDTIEIQDIELDTAKQEVEADSRVRTEFLANMSHEVRIPLNGIIGFTNLLLKTDLTGKQAEYLNRVKNSSESLLKIINAVLDNSKIETGTINPEDRERLSVLAVDDNQINLKLVCRLLEDLGVEVTVAHSGEEAVRYASETHFDLVLMDVEMPGMNGIEAMKRIHDNEAQGQKIPVVALTAHAQPDEIMQLLNAGMDDYVVKPVSDQQLRAKLDKWAKSDVSIQPPEKTRDKLIVDWESGLKLANNKRELAQELLAILKDTLPEDQLAINNAFNAEKAQLLQQHVHRLKGAVKYCGVPGIQEAVGQFEITLKTGNSIQARSALDLLNNEIKMFIDWWNTTANHMH